MLTTLEHLDHEHVKHEPDADQTVTGEEYQLYESESDGEVNLGPNFGKHHRYPPGKDNEPVKPKEMMKSPLFTENEQPYYEYKTKQVPYS